MRPEMPEEIVKVGKYTSHPNWAPVRKFHPGPRRAQNPPQFDHQQEVCQSTCHLSDNCKPLFLTDTLICGVEMTLAVVSEESTGPKAWGEKGVICDLSLFFLSHFLLNSYGKRDRYTTRHLRVMNNRRESRMGGNLSGPRSLGGSLSWHKRANKHSSL